MEGVAAVPGRGARGRQWIENKAGRDGGSSGCTTGCARIRFQMPPGRPRPAMGPARAVAKRAAGFGCKSRYKLDGAPCGTTEARRRRLLANSSAHIDHRMGKVPRAGSGGKHPSAYRHVAEPDRTGLDNGRVWVQESAAYEDPRRSARGLRRRRCAIKSPKALVKAAAGAAACGRSKLADPGGRRPASPRRAAQLPKHAAYDWGTQRGSVRRARLSSVGTIPAPPYNFVVPDGEYRCGRWPSVTTFRREHHPAKTTGNRCVVKGEMHGRLGRPHRRRITSPIW